MRKKIAWIGALVLIIALVAILMNVLKKGGSNTHVKPLVMRQFLEEAKKNSSWKTSVITGKNEQIVFMNISPMTNRNNEIGKETHPFDQVIYIVEGKGKANLNGRISAIESGDLIFIPQGTSHNVVNIDTKKPLKIVSFYSANDMPKNTTYKTKVDEKN